MTALLGPGRPRPAGMLARSIDVGGIVVRIAASAIGPSAGTSVSARGLAEGLVAQVAGLPERAVRVATLLPSGRPVAWAGAETIPVAVSVSHLPGLSAAAAAGNAAGIGIDVVESRGAGAALGWWFDAGERAWAEATLPERVWGAKEAAFKAAGVDDGFDPRAVDVRADGAGGFLWRLAGRWRDAEGAGRFVPMGRWLIAVASRAADPRPGSPGRVACS